VFLYEDRFWPTVELSQDEERGSGKYSKAAAQKFRVILSATDPTRTPEEPPDFD
jgi:hypothetical protein